MLSFTSVVECSSPLEAVFVLSYIQDYASLWG
jgi:hypothetical protein